MSDQQERAEGSDLRVLSRIWEFARPDMRVFLLSLVLTPFIAAMSLVQPYLMKQIIDEHIVTGQLEGLQRACWLYLGYFFFDFVLT